MEGSAGNHSRERWKPPLLWVSAIALISFLVTMISPPAHPKGIARKLVKQSVGGDIVFRARSRGFAGRRHSPHHRRRGSAVECEQFRRAARIAAEQNATLILTVGHNGCANFSSLQRAVDAVPDYSPGRTFVILDSGVFRSQKTPECFRIVVHEGSSRKILEGRNKKSMAGRKWSSARAR